VAYAILPSETVIAHSADFSTEKCFSHKVSLEFSPSSAVPGEETTLQVTAQPDSLCGVSAVDQSVLIKEPGKTLETDKIFELLPVRKATSIPHDIQDPVECLHVWTRPRRYVLPYPYHDKKGDAHTVFQNVGLKMATNLFIRVPSCLKFKGREYHQGHFGLVQSYSRQTSRMRGPVLRMEIARDGMVDSGGSGGSPQLPPIETVRTFFPETWIWDLVEMVIRAPMATWPILHVEMPQNRTADADLTTARDNKTEPIRVTDLESVRRRPTADNRVGVQRP
ncbi:alpha-2-macroglobulin-like, partial [Morone saxatilis]|uniref:alpha-2-macroglobulin-like n=1 Tax=Morone saxatilis TaxID=34816 RepID=UPI0015E1DB5A